MTPVISRSLTAKLGFAGTNKTQVPPHRAYPPYLIDPAEAIYIDKVKSFPSGTVPRAKEAAASHAMTLPATSGLRQLPTAGDPGPPVTRNITKFAQFLNSLRDLSVLSRLNPCSPDIGNSQRVSTIAI